MKHYFSLILIIIAIAYIFSPVDLFPDAIPFLGFFDDVSLVGLLLYYLKYKKLPDFEKINPFRQGAAGKYKANGNQETKHRNKDSNVSGPGRENEDIKSPHEILNVRPGATQDEIQAAYRKAASKYHPDKVAHLGNEFQELARKRFIQIQNAYDALKK